VFLPIREYVTTFQSIINF